MCHLIVCFLIVYLIRDFSGYRKPTLDTAHLMKLMQNSAQKM